MEDGDSDNQHMYESNGVQEDIGMAEKESNARKKKVNFVCVFDVSIDQESASYCSIESRY